MRKQFDAIKNATAQGIAWDEQRRCGKVRFPSLKIARARAKRLHKDYYRCPICKSYHLGR